MPKTNVSPAASRKSSIPSWMPLRHCSKKYSIWSAIPSPPRGHGREEIDTAHGQHATTKARWLYVEPSSRSGSLVEHDLFRKPVSTPDQVRGRLFRDHALLPQFHRATVVEAVLVVLDDGGDGLEHVLVALFDHVLQIKVLDWDVVVAEFEIAAHRLEVGLFHRLSDVVL